MTKIIKTTVVALALSLTTLYAGAGHNHAHDSHGHAHDSHANESMKKVNEEIVAILAKKLVVELVVQNKIPTSWKSVPVATLGKTNVGNTNDWEVTFKNAKVQDKTKQTLYIFIDTYGKLMGVNYTGK